MPHATASVNANLQPLEGSLKSYLDSTQKSYFNGTYLQNDAGTDELVSATTSTVGMVVGICSENYEYASPYSNKTLRVDIQPCIRKDLSITGASTSTMGYPVWATYDTTLTLTYATGAKLIGFAWVLQGSVVLIDIGFLGRAIVGLCGSPFINQHIGTIVGLELSAAFRMRYTATKPCVITAVKLQNLTAIAGGGGGADVTFTLKKNNAGSVLATYQLDSATERAVEYEGSLAPSSGTVLAKGDTIDLYSGTIAQAITAGLINVVVEGYAIAN